MKITNTDHRMRLGYETPTANVVTIQIEGITCASDAFLMAPNEIEISDWVENPDAL